MRFTITARHIGLTEALKAYAEKKILDRVGHLIKENGIAEDTVAAVEIERETRHHRKGEIWKAAVTIALPHEKQPIHAQASADDLYAAVDFLSEEIARELKTEKGRMRALMLRGARAVKRAFRFSRFAQWRRVPDRIRNE
jgi:ribosomal subunit interface protein